METEQPVTVWMKTINSPRQMHATYQFAIFPSGSCINGPESTTSQDVLNGVRFVERVFFLHCKKKHSRVEISGLRYHAVWRARGIRHKSRHAVWKRQIHARRANPFSPLSSFTFALRNTFRLLIFRAKIFDILLGDENITCEHERTCTSNPYASSNFKTLVCITTNVRAYCCYIDQRIAPLNSTLCWRCANLAVNAPININFAALQFELYTKLYLVFCLPGIFICVNFERCKRFIERARHRSISRKNKMSSAGREKSWHSSNRGRAILT